MWGKAHNGTAKPPRCNPWLNTDSHFYQTRHQDTHSMTKCQEPGQPGSNISQACRQHYNKTKLPTQNPRTGRMQMHRQTGIHPGRCGRPGQTHMCTQAPFSTSATTVAQMQMSVMGTACSNSKHNMNSLGGMAGIATQQPQSGYMCSALQQVSKQQRAESLQVKRGVSSGVGHSRASMCGGCCSHACRQCCRGGNRGGCNPDLPTLEDAV